MGLGVGVGRAVAVGMGVGTVVGVGVGATVGVGIRVGVAVGGTGVSVGAGVAAVVGVSLGRGVKTRVAVGSPLTQAAMSRVVTTGATRKARRASFRRRPLKTREGPCEELSIGRNLPSFNNPTNRQQPPPSNSPLGEHSFVEQCGTVM